MYNHYTAPESNVFFPTFTVISISSTGNFVNYIRSNTPEG